MLFEFFSNASSMAWIFCITKSKLRIEITTVFIHELIIHSRINAGYDDSHKWAQYTKNVDITW